MVKKDICVSINTDLLKELDERRGDLVPRSRLIEHLVKRGLESGDLVPPLAN